MYTLANIDFSNRFVVSDLPPDEIDRQDPTPDAKQGALRDLATASSPARDLERAVFGAA
jgi:hypothetical protein